MKACCTICAVATVLICAATSAQTTIQPALCASFNADPGGVPAQLSFCNASMSTAFVATSAFTVTAVDLYLGGGTSVGAALANMSTGAGTATTYVSPPSFGAAWITITLSTPVVFSANDTGSIQAIPLNMGPGGNTLIVLYTNPVGTAPLPLTRICGNPCTLFGQPPCVPGTTQQTLMFRLRGPMCTAGIPAITTIGGAPCGTPSPLLTSQFATVGAQTFSMNLQSASPPGVQAYLFLAEGSITAGVPVEGGHPCSVFLNLVSFANLAAFGYEPFATATIASFGGASFAVPIPNDAALAGYNVTFQAAIIDPSGIPLATVPGVGLKLSNALQIQIGE